MKMEVTKGRMVTQLKKLGVRRAEKTGVGTVALEHLKYSDIARLHAQVLESYLADK